MLELLTAQTPNGWMASITLEELGLDYEFRPQLAKTESLAGDYSLADIANYAWAKIHRWAGVDVLDLPNLQRWMEKVRGPAVQRGCEVPIQVEFPSDEDDERLEQMAQGARSILQK